MVISFSGLDGAGKSHQINRIKDYLLRGGYSVDVKSMYFDLTFYAFLRKLINQSRTSHDTPIKSESSESVSVIVKIFANKNIKRVFYLIDLLLVNAYVISYKWRTSSVLILDRYLYDQLIDISSDNFSLSHKLMMKVICKPDFSIFMLVSPVTSYKRKREYNIDYLSWRYKHYVNLYDQIPNAHKKTLIYTDSEDEIKTFNRIMDYIRLHSSLKEQL